MLSLTEWVALLENGKASFEAQVIVSCCVVAVALVVTFVYRNWLCKLVKKIVKRSNNKWDDYLMGDKPLKSFGLIIPFFIVYEALPFSLCHDIFIYEALRRIILAVLISLISNSLCIVISGINEKIQSSSTSNRPTAGIFQMVKIIVWFIAFILIVAALMNRNPGTLLTGLTAFAALLSLIFKDIITGHVAGVQLAAYDMVHVGDWISMEQHGIDGNVEEVSINIVKVRNWDNTVATISPYLLMTESFQNYSKIFQDKARRISIEFFLDFNSVRLCTPEMEESLKEKGLYVEKGEVELDVEEIRKVNLTLFSRYVEKFLAEQPYLRKDKFFLVRVKQPVSTGLPFEVYCFVDNVMWKHFEHTKSRVVEHIVAVMPEFGLCIFQSPSGMDLSLIKK